EHISTRVAVMYLGTICELAEAADLFASPRHPYTQALLSAIPRLGKKRKGHVKLQGEVPTPINLPPGCVFHRRCRFARDICGQEFPELVSQADGRLVACHGVREGWIG
ncbi:MAG: ABC transporter ATP-binding protein, partial [Promethearchaeia archaeon]